MTDDDYAAPPSLETVPATCETWALYTYDIPESSDCPVFFSSATIASVIAYRVDRAGYVEPVTLLSASETTDTIEGLPTGYFFGFDAAVSAALRAVRLDHDYGCEPSASCPPNNASVAFVEWAHARGCPIGEFDAERARKRAEAARARAAKPVTPGKSRIISGADFLKKYGTGQ